MTEMTDPKNAMTHGEFLTTLTERFGESPYNWAFVCPNCGDVATGADFKAALESHPRTRRDGTAVAASDMLGQQCIGRVLGALSRPRTKVMEDSRKWGGRGCDWTAFGLFHGPLFVNTGTVDDPKWTPSFEIAPARTTT